MDGSKPTGREVSTGIRRLDRLIGHLHLGDNVIWYDSAGGLAWPFTYRFIQSSQSLRHPLLYLTFDSPPGDLLSTLGPLADYPHLTILDCFTWGKGRGSDKYLAFYYEDRMKYPGRILRVDNPLQPGLVGETLWGTYASMEGGVRLVFDSLTGMRDLWSEQKDVGDFYEKTCPKLYSMETVSYWLVKGEDLPLAIRSRMNDTAQVVIDLAEIGETKSISPVKTSGLAGAYLSGPHTFWIEEDNSVAFEDREQSAIQLELSSRLKKARQLRGLPQKELARRVGVSPSTISQIESNALLPSIPTLLKIAGALTVEPGFFFPKQAGPKERLVYSAEGGDEMVLPHVPTDSALVKNITPVGSDFRTDIFSIELAPQSRLGSHFLAHKGEEIGCLLSGEVQFTVGETVYRVAAGDVVYLTSDAPDEWQNPGVTPARLLWIKMK